MQSDYQNNLETTTPAPETKIRKGSDLIFYLFDENGNLKVLTTIERPLTKEEFELIEQNLAAYKYVMDNHPTG
jgi:hypothetical protein